MRIFLGMILGALLTVAAAYVHDSFAGGGAVASGTTGSGHTTAGQAMVNWDVVGRNWKDLRSSVREMGDRIHDEWVKRAG